MSDTVEVELEGLASELEALDASALTGSIDVSGMTEGEHTVNLELNLDSKFKLVKKATVTVDIVSAGSMPNTASGGNESNRKDTQEGSSEKPDDSANAPETNKKPDASTELED